MKQSTNMLCLIVSFAFLCSFTKSLPRSLQTSGSNTLAINSPICLEAYALGCDFAAWKTDFSQTYSTPEEDEFRHLIFCQNCTIIKGNSAGYTMKLTKWAASTQQELDQHFGLRNQNLSDQSVSSARVSSTADIKVAATIPTTLDYRNYNGSNYVTSVKDQGSCGCCWSFAATAAYESYLMLNGHTFGLSQQAALQCTSYYAPNQRVSDCSGGYFPDPFYFLAKVGSVLRTTYPYLAANYGSGAGFPTTPGICSEQNRIFLGNGTVSLYAPLISSGGLTPSQIKSILVTNGPQMIGVYANTGFNFYSSGTYTGCPADSYNFINHAITLVGWTNTGWIAKNQWGTSWGNAGYIELDFTNDCGMKYLLGSVTVANKNSNVQVVMSTGVSSTWEPKMLLSVFAIILLGLLF